jgi:type IV fimbrial biogenesis protein FimT
MPTPPALHRRRGLTLIELMVALALLALLATLAVPSFQRQIASANVTNAANELLLAASRARTEAIRLGARVTVCKSSDGTQCDTTSAGWETGWITFVDPTRNATGPASVDTGETVTFAVSALSGVKILGNGDLANYISYSADGRARLMNGGFLAGRLRVCSPSAALDDDHRARDLCISSTGRAVLVTPAGINASCPAPSSSSC